MQEKNEKTISAQKQKKIMVYTIVASNIDVENGIYFESKAKGSSLSLEWARAELNRLTEMKKLELDSSYDMEHRDSDFWEMFESGNFTGRLARIEIITSEMCQEAVPKGNKPTASDDGQHDGLAKYTVTIEEHIAQEFPVEAHDLYQAMQTAEEQYHQGLLVVQSSTPNARLIMARDDETGHMTEWKEF